MQNTTYNPNGEKPSDARQKPQNKDSILHSEQILMQRCAYTLEMFQETQH